MSIGGRIKMLREKERYSQKALAEKIGVKPNSIWRWESNKTVPDATNMQKIASLLNTNIDYILNGSDDELQQQVIELADSSWSDNMPNQISAGFDGTHYEIYDGNTNQTIRIPNDTEGRKIFLEFMQRTLNFRQPVVSNTITGDNNSGNKLGVINN